MLLIYKYCSRKLATLLARQAEHMYLSFKLFLLQLTHELYIDNCI